MSPAPYRVHRLIQDLNRDPPLVEAFLREPEAVFQAYGIAESERQLLRDGTPRALITLGVHPNLQMKFLRIRRAPEGGGASPLASYLRDLGHGG
jgi:2'-aminobiphenyl-2,3-diol 1,2-dioxygenase small subunit